ncbi:MAG: hypothetical protein EBT64_03335 [Gammaproteobacteria bacterium]|jgi:Flagellar transcriptional activator (FlhC)|nr:hypothetical protein [Gammaproteobacteria bacterium]
MHVTDERYKRDRLRLELALRLIRHEARTHTIRHWTGLSDDRVRKLYRSYIKPGAGVRRHRGKSPAQVSYFLRATTVGAEAHALASILLLFGAINDQPDPASLKKIPTIARGRLLCDSYEAYRRVSPRPRIDFEHAAFLAKALTLGDEIRLRFCAACQALNIVETVTLRDPSCRACEAPMPEKPTGSRGSARLSTHSHAKPD